MKKLILLVLIGFVETVFAQADSVITRQMRQAKRDSIWSKKGSVSFNFANVGLSNWAGGGQSSIALGSILNYNMKRVTAKSQFETSIVVAYGLTRVGGSDFPFKKSDDRLGLISQYNYNMSPNQSISALVNFGSQMDVGYKISPDANRPGKETRSVISRFMAPGYLISSLGYQLKQKNIGSKTTYSILFSPLTGKMTFVLNDSLAQVGAFGVKPGEHIRSELGAGFNFVLNSQVMENISFRNSLNLFSNYQTMPNIDVTWETLLVMKINKYMNANFSTNLIYDDDVILTRKDGTQGRDVQFKHVLNIGVGFIF